MNSGDGKMVLPPRQYVQLIPTVGTAAIIARELLVGALCGPFARMMSLTQYVSVMNGMERTIGEPLSTSGKCGGIHKFK